MKYQMDKQLIRDIRGMFSSLARFQVSFEMKQSPYASHAAGCCITLNVMWDIDQPIEHFQRRLAAAQQESKTAFPTSMDSYFSNKMSRMVEDLVRNGSTYGEWM